MPKRVLTPGTSHQHGKHRRRRDTARPVSKTPAVAQVRRRPNEGHAQADLRQIGETVGHRMLSGLYHHPAHRHQHPHVPQPTHEQIRVAPPGGDRAQREARQHGQGTENFPDRQVTFRVGIIRGQSQRAKQLTQVGNVGHQGVGDSRGQGDVRVQRRHAALRPKGHQARYDGQQQERQLLKHQLPAKREPPEEGCQMVCAAGEAPPIAMGGRLGWHWRRRLGWHWRRRWGWR